MTIPVTTVTATFFDTNGTALPGVVLAATLSGLDVYNDQYVTNRYFTGTTNSSGVATLVLYTNSDGLRSTYYNFKVTYNGRVLSDSNVTLSGASVNFADVEGNYDGGIINPPPGNYSITGNLTITGTLAAGATTLSSLVLVAPLPVAQGGTGATDAANARANLELGTMSQQNANNVAITGGTIDGVTITAIAGATSADGVSVTPVGAISSTDVQAALQELDTEKSATSHTHSGVYQPADATLSSLANLGTAADRYAYTTGADTWAEGTITAAGRAILDDANAAAQLVTLGAASTTAVQNSTLISLTSVGGTGNAITAGVPDPYTALADGQEFSFIAAAANTGAVTIALDGGAATDIKKSGGLALELGDIPSGGFVKIKYVSSTGDFEMMGGAGGGGAKADGCIYENSLTVSNDYTLTTSKNGFSVGPITIDTGVAVTIPSGQRWVVL